MAYKLLQTDAFQRDFDAVIAYLVLALKNRAAAASLLDAIESSCGDLQRMPLMYEACRDPYLSGLGYRKAGIHGYILIYKVDGEAKTVTLLRLFHSRQDYEKLI